MIFVIIICGILYLFIIYGVIYLYYTYRKDIEAIENRNQVLEKRISVFEKFYNSLYSNKDTMVEIVVGDIHFIKSELLEKEKEDMTCKKGRGGRKK